MYIFDDKHCQNIRAMQSNDSFFSRSGRGTSSVISNGLNKIE